MLTQLHGLLSLVIREIFRHITTLVAVPADTGVYCFAHVPESIRTVSDPIVKPFEPAPLFTCIFNCTQIVTMKKQRGREISVNSSIALILQWIISLGGHYLGTP